LSTKAELPGDRRIDHRAWRRAGRRTRQLLALALSASLAVAAPASEPSFENPSLAAERIAGQRVIFSYAGPTPPPTLLQRVREGGVAGVIFFSDNIGTAEHISRVIDELQRAQRQSGVKLPLLLMTDQEGGLVRRLIGPPALSEKAVGQAADPAAVASETGASAGDNLASVGMNVNLAPVLDVYAEPGNFVDHDQRSYDSDPNIVAVAGSAFITAQQRAGVMTTAKHFPGLGSASTGQNTDLRAVTLRESLNRLRGVDEAPFSAAIAAGVRLVMVSWAVYPALDSHYPAGLSPIVVGSELRDRLAYTGVTITDALEAHALDGFGDTGQRAVLAASAGMDLILCSSQRVGQGDEAVRALASAFASGRLGSAKFRASVDRIDALRAQLR
jgi:beta-N-acetylhexosaminidase